MTTRRTTAIGLVIALLALLIGVLVGPATAMAAPAGPATPATPADPDGAPPAATAGPTTPRPTATIAPPSLAKVAVGEFHSCAVADDQRIFCWGENGQGQLGNGTTIDSPQPTSVQTVGTPLAGKSIAQLSVGDAHSCALTTDGAVACWGAGHANGAASSSPVPIAVATAGTPLAGKTVDVISAGGNHTCAVADGTAACWGGNGDGQLGNGATTTSDAPVAVTTAGTPFAGKTMATISAGYRHSCAAATDGTAACWGYNAYGALGDNTTTSSSTAVALAAGALTGKSVSQIGAGALFTCALATDGSMACWGWNVDGELGNNSTTQSKVPVAVTTAGTPLAGKTVSRLEVGGNQSCALTTDDILACWGLNLYGQMGQATQTGNAKVPVAVVRAGTPLAGDTIADLSSGENTTCAVTTGGAGACWGFNWNGQVGNGRIGHEVVPAPLSPGALAGRTVAGVAAGEHDSCAFATDNTIACWGWNLYGNLGDNTTLNAWSPVAVATAGTPLAGKTIEAVDAGSFHNCALATDDTMGCWGTNTYGQLGNNSNTTAKVPVGVVTAGTPLAGKAIAQLVLGGNHTCALATDSTIACWGANTYGQLGNNSTTSSKVPVAVATAGTPLAGKAIARLAAGNYHTCAVATDGTIGCWGYNLYGQLGNNTTTNSSVPVGVITAGTPLAGKSIGGLAAGYRHTCALATDGTIGCWGANTNGQLGNGTTTASKVPVAVTTAGTPLAGVAASRIEAGEVNTCAIASSGSVLACWGDDTWGAVGDGGAAITVKVPTSVATAGTPLAGKAIADLDGGANHTCAVATDGTTSCWGNNHFGSAGTGYAGYVTLPTALADFVVLGPPAAPTMGSALAGNAQATVTWTAPYDDGGTPVTGYTVTPYVGATAQAPRVFASTATTQVITGLTNGTAYTFKVAATNARGTGPQSDASNAVTPAVPAPTGSTFVATTPCRVVDTRVAGGPMLNNTDRTFRITGSGSEFAAQGGKAGGCGIPAGAVAIEASVTAVTPSVSGYLRAWPAGTSMPNATFLNFVAGQSITNTGTIPIATTGTQHLRLRNVGGTTHYVIDVQGYYVPDTSGATYVPITPCRIADTRAAGGPLVANAQRSFRVTGSGSEFAAQGGKSGGCSIPPGAVAIEASLSAVAPSGAGYTRAWPAGTSMPNATFLNYVRNQGITNTGSLRLATTGTVHLTIRNFVSTSHFVIDVQGFFVAASTANRYVSITPCRVVDNRVAGGPLAAGATRAFQITGTGSGFVAQGGKTGGCGIPTGATAVEASVTAVSPPATGYFRAWPSTTSMPTATFLNFTRLQSITNTGTLSLALSGTQQLRVLNAASAPTNYVIDIQGYFTPPPIPTVPGAPTIAPATAGNGQATVSWSAPLTDGGSPITGYVVTPYIGEAAQSPAPFDATTTTRTIPGLANGTTYTFRVAAVNAVGTGPQSGASNAVTPVSPVTVPGAPTIGTATAGDAEATVTWTAPASDGGSALTGYVVTPYLGAVAQTPVPFDASTTTRTITGLTNGATYTFKVAAVNAVGTGPQSAASNEVTPEAVVPPGPPLQVATGGETSCAVLDGGTVRCWGNNDGGQVGDGTTTNRLTPVPVVGISAATQVAVGGAHACALLAGGTVACWGKNDRGQLGDGSTTWSSTPVPVSGITSATSVTAGQDHSCATISGGTAVCWGRNDAGQLGHGDTAESHVPVSVLGLTTANRLSAGTSHTCALLSGTGTVKCWGSNQNAQLGDGTHDGSSLPVSVSGLTGAGDVAAGDAHTCARVSGTVKCWGRGDGGALGTGTWDDSPTPATVTGISTATSIGVGRGHSCAVLSGGGVSCWGYDYFGQLGDGARSPAQSPVAVSGLTGATTVSGGELHTCALTTGGTVRCWGSNISGELGTGVDWRVSTPVVVSGMTTATGVGAGREHSCAVRANGTVACWGWNYLGVLGDGTANDSAVPVTVSGITTATAVAVGGRHSCALLAGGSVMCWGNNSSGELGDGTGTDSPIPVPVTGITTATAISAGPVDSCALLADGSVRCWGGNDGGQLGDGTTDDSTVPVTVAGITTAVAPPAIGELHACVALSGGTVSCWGGNYNGQLGNGTTDPSLSPIAVPGITTATSVTAGPFHTCARLSTGALRCWGNNGYGQLGDGTTEDRSSPVAVVGITTASSVTSGGGPATGFGHTCAVLADGSVRCWGNGIFGDLGNGGIESSPTPVAVLGITSAASLAVGPYHACARLTGGSVRCWGNGLDGELGDGTLGYSTVPTIVIGLPT